VAIFDLEYFKRGVIGAYITSPGGTESQVLSARQFDSLTGEKRHENLTTTSVHFWAEQSYGTWEFSLRNDLVSHGMGSGKLKFVFFSINVYRIGRKKLFFK
jgi:subtilisin-like proprotein convertase family protein